MTAAETIANLEGLVERRIMEPGAALRVIFKVVARDILSQLPAQCARGLTLLDRGMWLIENHIAKSDEQVSRALRRADRAKKAGRKGLQRLSELAEEPYDGTPRSRRRQWRKFRKICSGLDSHLATMRGSSNQLKSVTATYAAIEPEIKHALDEIMTVGHSVRLIPSRLTAVCARPIVGHSVAISLALIVTIILDRDTQWLEVWLPSTRFASPHDLALFTLFVVQTAVYGPVIEHIRWLWCRHSFRVALRAARSALLVVSDALAHFDAAESCHEQVAITAGLTRLYGLLPAINENTKS